MDNCPYKDLPDEAWWRDSVANLPAHLIHPLADTPFRISASDTIATAGSCFAQHIARRLPELGLTYFVSEAGPTRLTDEERSQRQYGTFSARYGNIYTTRQFLQLLRRAYGEFSPVESAWQNDRGGYHDPFRPSVEPSGFSSVKELEWDRTHHLAAVREVVEQSDIFIFTLGLTEAWRDRRDGAVFPVCPGCGYGNFDPGKFEFVNFSVRDVNDDLDAIRALFRARNQNAKIILTVSPVPLLATMSGVHVLAATTYSKSVLRVAAQEASSAYDNCVYFPSYEIITGPQARGLYYRDDLREVTTHGVDQVMSSFRRAFCLAGDTVGDYAPASSANKPDNSQVKLSGGQLVCDEEELSRRYRSA